MCLAWFRISPVSGYPNRGDGRHGPDDKNTPEHNCRIKHRLNNV